MTRRHTHVGAFTGRSLPPMLVAELHAAVHAERAELVVIGDGAKRDLLTELIRGAENALCADPAAADEIAYWATTARSGRRDGVPASGRHCDAVAFAERGHLRTGGKMRTADTAPQAKAHFFGTAVLLTTCGDKRLDWLLAGRALQRLLLHAAARDVSAAFHTQPLELPGPRSRIKAEIAAGAYPQALLRIGYADHARVTPRRPVTDVLVAREPQALVPPPGQVA